MFDHSRNALGDETNIIQIPAKGMYASGLTKKICFVLKYVAGFNEEFPIAGNVVVSSRPQTVLKQ